MRCSDDAGGGSSNEWSTLAGLEIRTRIARYLNGITRDASSRTHANVCCTFLARSLPQDVVKLNKHAIGYRVCDQIAWAVRNGTAWEEECEFASSELRVTATVVAVAHWPVSFMLGEHGIIRRWAEESNGKPMEAKTSAVLCVDEQSKSAHITELIKLLPINR